MVVVPVGMSFRCEYITMSSLYIYYNIYNEARGLLEAGPSVILGQEGSNLSSSPAVNGCVILLMVMPCPLLSSDTHTHTRAHTHPVNCPISLQCGPFPFFVPNFTDAC